MVSLVVQMDDPVQAIAQAGCGMPQCEDYRKSREFERKPINGIMLRYKSKISARQSFSLDIVIPTKRIGCMPMMICET